jgi:hypothetical protein
MVFIPLMNLAKYRSSRYRYIKSFFFTEFLFLNISVDNYRNEKSYRCRHLIREYVGKSSLLSSNCNVIDIGTD